MPVTENIIKQAFTRSEDTLKFCWFFLVDLKEFNIQENDFTKRLIIFQERLATSIFELQSLRDKIIKEEKETVNNKKRFNEEWFKSKMKRLAGYKKGIDYMVDKAKALGDAYAYFFYQNDLEKLNEHLSHQRIVNHTAGNGERGELEFVKRFKHVQGEFTLFHGITNILRYGDFSFIDLKNFKVTQIGELKTKWVAENTLESSMMLFRKAKGAVSNNKTITDPEREKDRAGRQQLGIANFLKGKTETNLITKNLVDKSYAEEITQLLKKSKINQINAVQVSDGLAFTCMKFKPVSLYNHLSRRETKSIVDKASHVVKDIALKLIKPDIPDNSIVIGQLLYNPDFTDKNTPGTVPIFWHPIDNGLLKDVYFGQSVIMSIFNPIHLIHDVEASGFSVDSKYSEGMTKDITDKKGVIQYFDLFISYIINHLLTENFVLSAIEQIKQSNAFGNNAKIQIKPQQHIDILPRKRSS